MIRIAILLVAALVATLPSVVIAQIYLRRQGQSVPVATVVRRAAITKAVNLALVGAGVFLFIGAGAAFRTPPPPVPVADTVKTFMQVAPGTHKFALISLNFLCFSVLCGGGMLATMLIDL